MEVRGGAAPAGLGAGGLGFGGASNWTTQGGGRRPVAGVGRAGRRTAPRGGRCPLAGVGEGRLRAGCGVRSRTPCCAAYRDCGAGGGHARDEAPAGDPRRSGTRPHRAGRRAAPQPLGADAGPGHRKVGVHRGAAGGPGGGDRDRRPRRDPGGDRRRRGRAGARPPPAAGPAGSGGHADGAGEDARRGSGGGPCRHQAAAEDP
mmetsp:Transcript_48332/g.149260  ORF Transcript_48332/g.149260 Transcript_48332/m.149260 type:complete len:203 (+) Transcript_48332:433-1041(+)